MPPPPAPRDRAELERELGLPAGGKLVVAAGRLVPVKNHALAIRAIADVPGAALAILGEGPLQAELERQATELGIADRVVLAGLRSDARAIMGAADAVVVSSVGEGLPLVALEALAARTPLVATSVRGIRELLTDGRRQPARSGRRRRSARGGAAARARRTTTLAARLADAGTELVAPYTEERMVSAYLETYERLLAR